MNPNKYSYDSINNLREKLNASMVDLDLDVYENILEEYTSAVQQYFKNASEKNLTYADIEKLKHLKTNHEVILNYVQQKKGKLIQEIKIFNAGKEMRNTYPETS